MAQKSIPLTKEDVQKYPVFTNHKYASAYLKEIYGEDFVVYRKPIAHEKRLMFS